MTSKQDILAQIITLAAQNEISAQEIETAMLGSKPAKLSEKTGGSIAIKIFSILGGIFICAGIFAFVGSFWDKMGSAARVIITLGSGFAAYIVGVTFFRKSQYVAAISPILLAAAFFETGGLFVLIHEYFNNHTNNWRLACLIVSGVMLVQQGLTFVSMRIPVLLFTTLWAGSSFFTVAFDMLNVSGEWNAIIVGFSLLVIAYNLSDSIYQKTLQLAYIFGAGTFFSGMAMIFFKSSLYEFSAAIVGTSLLCIAYGVRSKIYQSTLLLSYVVASWLFLYGWFDALKGTSFEVLYIAIACFMIYFSVIVNSTVLLIISVLSMLSYIGYYTAQHFVHSVGWPLALIILGILFFIISAGALRIKKKYIS